MFTRISKNKDFIIILSILILVVIFVILIASSFAYFKTNQTASGEIQLGELDYTINVIHDNAKNYLPGDNIEIDVNIENKVTSKTNLVPFYFRFKILSDEEYALNFITISSTDSFIVDEQYYYYKYKLQAGGKATLINNIYIDPKFSDQSLSKLNLSVLVDAVQSEYGAYKEIFPNAPTEWIEFIENN